MNWWIIGGIIAVILVIFIISLAFDDGADLFMDVLDGITDCIGD